MKLSSKWLAVLPRHLTARMLGGSQYHVWPVGEKKHSCPFWDSKLCWLATLMTYLPVVASYNYPLSLDAK